MFEFAINTFLQSTVKAKVFSTLFLMNIRKKFYFKTMLYVLYVSTKTVLLLYYSFTKIVLNTLTVDCTKVLITNSSINTARILEVEASFRTYI